MTNFNKDEISHLIFFLENTDSRIDGTINEKLISTLKALLNAIVEAEEAAAKKRTRKSPNKSGVLQLDMETGALINEYPTQKAAAEALNIKGSAISDAITGRNKTHRAYGYVWSFKDEYDQVRKTLFGK